MPALAKIRNPNAILRLARKQSKRWDATRTLPMDNVARSRAQSLLAGLHFLDNTTNPGPLTLGQAQDVLRWANGRIV